MTKSYYDILDVAHTATQITIRKAYILRVKAIHPDLINQETHPVKWKQANEMLKEFNLAYAVLSNPIERSRYDNGLLNNQPKRKQNTQPQHSEPNYSQTSTFDLNLHYGQTHFSKLPLGVKTILLERQLGKKKDQYQIKIGGISWNYFWLILSCSWFLLLFLFANDSRWTSSDFYYFIVGTSFACGVIGANANKLVKWYKAKLKCYLYVTPLYIIKTKNDRIWYWPISRIRDINVIFEKINPKDKSEYAGNKIASEAHIVFIDTKETISIKQSAGLFIPHLQSFRRKIHTAIEQQDWLYFYNKDDFREVVSTISPNKESSLIITLGTSILIGGGLFFAAYNINIKHLMSTDQTKLKPVTNQELIRILEQTEVPYVPYEKPSMYKQPIPENGWGMVYFGQQEAVAPLTIKTVSNGNHYFVKIVDWYTNRIMATCFVCSGLQATINLPLGSYKIKYATGDTWYGEKHLFGSNTSYNEAEKRFDIEVKGDYVTTYTVELFLQPNGNLHTKTISTDDW